MRYPAANLFRAQLPTGVVGFTGAAPQTVAGNQLDSGLCTMLCARVYAKATTNTLTLLAKWQILDDDGSTWRDFIDQNNTTNTVLVTGTGSAVTTVKYINAPNGLLAGGRFVRMIVVSGVGVGGGAGTDEASVEYDYRGVAFVV